MSPLAPIGGPELAKLAVTNLFSPLECERRRVCPITFKVQHFPRPLTRWMCEINPKYLGSWSIWSAWLINTVPHSHLSTCCCLHMRALHSAFTFLCVYWSVRRWHVNTIILLLPWLISQHCRLIEVRQWQPSDGKWAVLGWQQVQHSNYEKRTAIKLGHDSSEPTLCDFTVYI